MKLHSCWSKWRPTNWSIKVQPQQWSVPLMRSDWLGEEKVVMEELKTATASGGEWW